MVCTSRISGTLWSTTGSLVSRQDASIGRAAFLFPMVDFSMQWKTALDDEFFHFNSLSKI
jgi:hypothetical protein